MPNFTIRNEDYAARTHASFKRQFFMETLGAHISELDAGYCEVQLPYAKGLTQQHGYFHGGVIGTLADNTGGYASFTLIFVEIISKMMTVYIVHNLNAQRNGWTLVRQG